MKKILPLIIIAVLVSPLAVIGTSIVESTTFAFWIGYGSSFLVSLLLNIWKYKRLNAKIDNCINKIQMVNK